MITKKKELPKWFGSFFFIYFNDVIATMMSYS